MVTGSASPTVSPPVESPYVGLTHYTERYADRFFGRDAQTAVITGNLRAARLTLLYAESGVGKSSLLRAGVAARLRALAERDVHARGSPRFIPVVFSSWSDDPVAALIDAIGEAVHPFLREESDVELPHDRLDEAVEVAAEALDATLLVILDQFEEYFLYSRGDDGQELFADQLARCVNRPDLRANFLISIREDAYAGIGDLFRGRIANVYGNFLQLEYLDRVEARDAIEKPIERTNELHPDRQSFRVEPALIDAVLDQTRRGRLATAEDGHGPDESGPGDGDANLIETTYLQLVMKRLWDEEVGAGSRVLRLETLERLGGAQTIIGTHLDRSMGALAPDQQGAAASIFRFLVTRAGTKVALTAEDLSEMSGLPESDIDPVLRRLSAGDLHILRPLASRDGLGGASYEIFHDALARPIVDWRTRTERAELAARVDQERAAKEQAQRAAVEAEEREAKEKKRRQVAVAGLGVLIIAAAIAFALVQTNLADRQQKAAQSVEAAEQISHLSATPRFDPVQAALGSVEAYQLWPTYEARDQTLAALQVNAALPKIAAGHTGDVRSVAFVAGHGSAKVASGATDDTVRLWNSDGSELDSAVADSYVTSVAVSPPSKGQAQVLAAAMGHGSVGLWNVVSDHLRRRPPLHGPSDADLNAVAFDPAEPHMLVAGGRDGHISVWNASSGQRVGVENAAGPVNGLAFTADGGALVSASDGGEQMWKVSGLRVSRPRRIARWPGSSVALAGNESYAVGIKGDRDGIYFGHILHGKSVFLPTSQEVHSVAFADRGSILVAGGADWNVTTWDVKTGRPFGPPRLHDHADVNGVAVSPDGRTIASAGSDGLVKLWPLDGKGALATTVGGLSPGEVSDSSRSIWDLAVGAHGQVAAAEGVGGGTSIWSLDHPAGTRHAPEPLTQIPSYGKPNYAVAFNGDVLAAARGKSFGLWETGPSCRHLSRLPCRLAPQPRPFASGPITALAFGESGELLASGNSYPGALSLWDSSKQGTIEHIWGHAHASNVNAVAFSPPNPLLAVAGDNGQIQIWNVHDPNKPTPIGEPLVGHGHQPVWSLAFSPDGKLLASGGEDRQVVLWTVLWDPTHDTATVRRIPSRLYQTQTILALAFSPDGKTLAAGDGDGNVCLYDAENRRTIGGSSCLPGHQGMEIDTMQFVPDGSRLLTGGDGNPIVAWNSILWNQDDDNRTTQALEADVCALAGRNLTADEWDEIFANTMLAQDRHKTCAQYPLP